jgi:hypothetical protein
MYSRTEAVCRPRPPGRSSHQAHAEGGQSRLSLINELPPCRRGRALDIGRVVSLAWRRRVHAAAVTAGPVGGLISPMAGSSSRGRDVSLRAVGSIRDTKKTMAGDNAARAWQQGHSVFVWNQNVPISMATRSGPVPDLWGSKTRSPLLTSGD